MSQTPQAPPQEVMNKPDVIITTRLTDSSVGQVIHYELGGLELQVFDDGGWNIGNADYESMSDGICAGSDIERLKKIVAALQPEHKEIAAFRQQVAEQLSRLLYLPQIIAEMEPNAARSARYQNLLTRAAAARLGLQLA